MRKKKRKNNRTILIILLAVLFVGVATYFSLQIHSYRQTNKELKARKERLEQLLEEENLRSKELEEEKIYVQTQKYIEEKAKSIGYVYPDEIIFRKDD
ncbi:MAG: septum formation initiator family protein [Lachnospiraceae bacterium]|nr:septum formation initiator family protein [Lachnospiraceae bacterium]